MCSVHEHSNHCQCHLYIDWREDIELTPVLKHRGLHQLFFCNSTVIKWVLVSAPSDDPNIDHRLASLRGQLYLVRKAEKLNLRSELRVRWYSPIYTSLTSNQYRKHHQVPNSFQDVASSVSVSLSSKILPNIPRAPPVSNTVTKIH